MSFIEKLNKNIRKIRIPVKVKDFIKKQEIPAKLEKIAVKLYNFSAEKSVKYYKKGRDIVSARSSEIFNRLDKKFDLRQKLKKADEKTKFTIFVKYISRNRLMFIYLPFIGWLYPVITKNEDDFAVYHSKESFALAVPFSIILLALFFLTFFIPFGARGFKLSVVVTIYLVELLYFVLSVIGIRNVINGRKQGIPFADRIFSRISSIFGL